MASALRWPGIAKKCPKIASKWHPEMVQGNLLKEKPKRGNWVALG